MIAIRAIDRFPRGLTRDAGSQERKLDAGSSCRAVVSAGPSSPDCWFLCHGSQRRKEPTTSLTTVRRSFGARAALSRSSPEACDISAPPLVPSLSLSLFLPRRTKRSISGQRERSRRRFVRDATRAEWSVRW
jgi:hypothetical protein